MTRVLIDALATEVHYLDHLLPVFMALPDEVRGDLYLPPKLMGLHPHAIPHRHFRSEANEVALVASHADLSKTRGRRAILMEHGSGQSYGGDPATARHAAYAGGTDRDNVLAFLCPNHHSANRNAEFYPDRLVAVVGSPILAQRQAAMTRSIELDNEPTVAFSFHWNCMALAETESGWSYFYKAIGELVEMGGYKVLGHGHPKILHDIAPAMLPMGAEVVTSFGEVLERADVLIGDNTSTIFEFAYLRGPVVLMDAPQYRQHVNHGLRFWDAADVGPRVAERQTIPVAIDAALNGWDQEEALELVYPAVEDPIAAAVDACLEALEPALVGVTPTRGGARFPRTSSGMM